MRLPVALRKRVRAIVSATEGDGMDGGPAELAFELEELVLEACRQQRDADARRHKFFAPSTPLVAKRGPK